MIAVPVYPLLFSRTHCRLGAPIVNPPNGSRLDADGLRRLEMKRQALAAAAECDLVGSVAFLGGSDRRSKSLNSSGRMRLNV